MFVQFSTRESEEIIAPTDRDKALIRKSKRCCLAVRRREKLFRTNVLNLKKIESCEITVIFSPLVSHLVGLIPEVGKRPSVCHFVRW